MNPLTSPYLAACDLRLADVTVAAQALNVIDEMVAANQAQIAVINAQGEAQAKIINAKASAEALTVEQVTTTHFATHQQRTPSVHSHTASIQHHTCTPPPPHLQGAKAQAFRTVMDDLGLSSAELIEYIRIRALRNHNGDQLVVGVADPTSVSSSG